MGSMNYWQYFRKAATGSSVPEIFTDYESKVQKYRRIIVLITSVMPLMVINIFNCLGRAEQPGWLILGLFFLTITVLFSYGLWRLITRVSQLKHL
jgi:hypothetical protein